MNEIVLNVYCKPSKTKYLCWIKEKTFLVVPHPSQVPTRKNAQTRAGMYHWPSGYSHHITYIYRHLQAQKEWIIISLPDNYTLYYLLSAVLAYILSLVINADIYGTPCSLLTVLYDFVIFRTCGAICISLISCLD